METYVANLHQLPSDMNHAVAIAGGKGAGLGALLHAGLPVPDGFVVLASAYRAHLDAADLHSKIGALLANARLDDLQVLEKSSALVSGWIVEAPMPLFLQKEILSAYDALGGQVAVRSSATAEDLPTASFAGQQETYLGVHGPEAVLAHVKACWASLWTTQAMAYRHAMGFDSMQMSLAVVVQKMVAADTAGVMFTANPVTGRRDELLINASYGLGESVVGGTVTPDTWVLDRKGHVRKRKIGTKEKEIFLTPNGTESRTVSPKRSRNACLDRKALQGLAAFACQVEAYHGKPMDIEWAIQSGRIYLLQARPITTLDMRMAQPDGTTREAVGVSGSLKGADRTTGMLVETNLAAGLSLDKDEQVVYQGKTPPRGFTDAMEHAPEPMFPLDFADYCQGDHAFVRFFGQMGFAAPKVGTGPVERKNGSVAIRLAQPVFTLSSLWRFPLYARKKAGVDPMDRWPALEREILSWLASTERETQALTHAREAMKGNLGDSGNGGHMVAPSPHARDAASLLLKKFDDFGQLMEKRFCLVFMAGDEAEKRMDKWLARAGDDAADNKASLLRGIPFRTALQNRALADLARVASRYGMESEAYGKARADFLAVYGDRPSSGMLPFPGIETWAENPEAVERLVMALQTSLSVDAAGFETANADTANIDTANIDTANADTASPQAQTALKSLPRRLRAPFQKALTIVRHSILVREESLFLIERMTARLRQLALVLGTLLVDQGVLDTQKDVFHLFAAELEPAANGELEVRERIRKRKAALENVWAAHRKGVHWFFSTGSFPMFPEPVDKRQGLFQRDPDGKRKTLYHGNLEGTRIGLRRAAAGETQSLRILKGLSASHGAVEGRVRVIREPAEFGRLEKGEVLVAPFTAPSWTPLFRLASAVVTEIGGPTSHAAIVSREYGIPAVCAVPRATHLLRDGQRVRVDGARGTVTCLKDGWDV